MVIRPLGDRVVIRPIQEGEKTYGSIVIPKFSDEKPQQGEVLTVGPGLETDSGTLIPCHVQVGQHVLFGRYAGTEIEMDHKKYLLIRDGDILAILDEGDMQ